MTALITVLSIIIFILLFNLVLCVVVHLKSFARFPPEKIKVKPKWFPYKDQMIDAEKFFLNLKMDDLQMEYKVGKFVRGYYVNQNSNKTVVLIHGYHSHSGDRMAEGKYYYNQGYNLFYPDLRALGRSDGNFIGMASDYEDILHWLDLLNEKYKGVDKIVINGVSMGGATACMLAGDNRLPKSVSAFIIDCPYTSSKEQIFHVLGKMPKFLKEYLWFVFSRYAKWFFGVDFALSKPIEAIAKANAPVLVIHGKTDTFVPFYMGEKIYESCGSKNKDCLWVENAEHALSYFVDTKAYETKVDEFLTKFVK